MTKVFDVDRFGIGMHRPQKSFFPKDAERAKGFLQSYFSLGLVGQNWQQPQKGVEANVYARQLKERQPVHVYFDIRGRSIIGSDVSGTKNDSEALARLATVGHHLAPGFGMKYREIYSQGVMSVRFLFDTVGLVDDVGKHAWARGNYVEPLPLGHFARNPEIWMGYHPNVGPLGASDRRFAEMNRGFVLRGRIPPRKILGMVVHVVGIDEKERRQSEQEWSSKIAEWQIEINGSSTSKLIPMYNDNGDLLWPKIMTHSEIEEKVSREQVKDKEWSDGEIAKSVNLLVKGPQDTIESDV